MSIINVISKFMFLFLLLLLNPPPNITKGCNYAPFCVDATRPLEQNVPKYINLKPKKGRGFQGRNVEDCLPKGFRRSSAPSRYINYQPLCSSPKAIVNAP
ncbi:unnamed protein product [Trifolium pratense]|uniref:Uncharacterized protein n=1 Tax=Trifolium pratense TaxID=57577 RepID=A0ACB0IC23_TRIPR|nr:unnamed protein product [Trifolium pratense]